MAKSKAKTLKKKSVATKSESKTTSTPLISVPITPGLVSISMMPDDLTTLTNLLSVCTKMFEEKALLAAENNDRQLFDTFSARHKLSTMFANKLVEFCYMPEPESREWH